MTRQREGRPRITGTGPKTIATADRRFTVESATAAAFLAAADWYSLQALVGALLAVSR